jgi:hypothetical protein
LGSWKVGKVESWKVGKLVSWKVGKLGSWEVGKLVRWKVGKLGSLSKKNKMKARLLKKLLNDTLYSVSNNEKYIAIGSSMCHYLISVDKETLEVKYALDTFGRGRDAIKTKELELVWDKIHELIESGQIKEIINGKDEIENPLPVFTVQKGKLVESVTDKYGWPNTDDNGICMYENTHFPTAKQAIEYGIREYKAGEEMALRQIKELEDKLSELKEALQKYRGYVLHLESL